MRFVYVQYGQAELYSSNRYLSTSRPYAVLHEAYLSGYGNEESCAQLSHRIESELDDMFSDVFGKSSRSIIQQILDHPGETFDVAPFIQKTVNTRLKRFRRLLTALSAANRLLN